VIIQAIMTGSDNIGGEATTSQYPNAALVVATS